MKEKAYSVYFKLQQEVRAIEEKRSEARKIFDADMASECSVKIIALQFAMHILVEEFDLRFNN